MSAWFLDSELSTCFKGHKFQELTSIYESNFEATQSEMRATIIHYIYLCCNNNLAQ